MNREIAMQWADALESGKYRQARHKLRDGEAMCCLGVLCALHDQAVGGEWVGDAYLGSAGTPPRDVEDWCGTPVYGNGIHIGLVILAEENDRGDTFADIARHIRRDWELL